MSDKTVVTNLKPVAEKLRRTMAARTNPAVKPKPGLANGLTPEAIQVFKLSKMSKKK